jgi:Arc/MetJ-type ribon-helix-helix transcriptional regulator
MPGDKPHSVRLNEELVQALDRHIGLRQLLDDRVSRSDVIREALEAYLPSFEDELRARARERLSESS